MKQIESEMNQSGVNGVDPRIQEICDSLHRLEALVSVSYAVPPESRTDTPHGYVFFSSALFGDKPGL